MFALFYRQPKVTNTVDMDKIAGFVKEYKKVLLIPLIMIVVLTILVLVLGALNPESSFNYLG
ncbi:MAG: hypothetical protein G3M78_07320 [Candidatus Nitrohelix vancouverensis]|uniref:Uncharacterized protein n=1 Tax=Candidatus Nitrohelix vancouverensis TaxID=2705534 RepID=A0A7T0G3D1_9BACT|nr:MAG: hypothetical protein G3M78_07320 [Candidatus Nitrohelix vancouverensis]